MRPPPPAKSMQPPQPPKPTRWQERSKEKSDTHGIAMVATLGQRTLAESRPTANQPGREPDGTPVPPAPKRVDAGAHLQSGIIDDGTAKGLTTQKSSQLPTTKVSAQTLAEVRPAPPSPPSTKEPKEDAPGTGELSAHAPDHLGAKKPTQPRHSPLSSSLLERHR